MSPHYYTGNMTVAVCGMTVKAGNQMCSAYAGYQPAGAVAIELG